MGILTSFLRLHSSGNSRIEIIFDRLQVVNITKKLARSLLIRLSPCQGNEWLVLPLVIMGVVSVIGGVSGLRLPETLHHRLPQTVEEGELFGADWNLQQCLQCIPKR